MYDFNFNFKNKDTDYRSGQEAHADYSLGYGVTPNWLVGVGGYVYRQTTGDELHGADIGNRGRAFAMVPRSSTTTAKDFSLPRGWSRRVGVRNRAEGHAFWVKASVPF